MGAAARPVRTKRPSRRAAEAAGGQIPSTTTRAASTKRPGKSAHASAHQSEARAVVGTAETAARSASRIGEGAKRRRRTAQIPFPPPRIRPRAKKETSGSHPLSLYPCSNRGGKRAGSDANRARSTGLPCPPDSIWREWANNLVDDDSPVSDVNHPPCPPDNNNWYVPSEEAFPLVCRSSHDCDSYPICRTRRRDWANLADGPAGLIAERVLEYDIADYVRFRAVCRPWRQCSTEPRSHSGLDRRFHPSRWTMLREELTLPDRRCFLNTSTGQCIQVDIPDLSDNLLLAVTPEGLLVLVRKTQRATVRLLNPLTGHLIELPPLTTLLPPEHHDMLLERNFYFHGQFQAWGSGIAHDDSTVVLCFDRLGMLGLAKPGDDSWKLLKYRCRDALAGAPLMFGGRFYCVNRTGVMVLEMGADKPPQLKLAAELSMHVSAFADSVHLLNNCGELMLVHRGGRRLTALNKSGMGYNTYRVDLDTSTLSRVKSFGGSAGRAVFMGLYCSLSVSLDVFPSGSISADTIYLSLDLRERMILTAGAYHLASGRVELPCSLVPRPHTLIACLSLSNTVEEC